MGHSTLDPFNDFIINGLATWIRNLQDLNFTSSIQFKVETMVQNRNLILAFIKNSKLSVFITLTEIDTVVIR